MPNKKKALGHFFQNIYKQMADSLPGYSMSEYSIKGTSPESMAKTRALNSLGYDSTYNDAGLINGVNMPKGMKFDAAQNLFTAVPKDSDINLDALNKAYTDALTKETTLGNALNGTATLGNLGTMALKSAQAHPVLAAGTGALALGNIGGLTDNDKFGAQLGGAGLGAYIGNSIAPGLGTIGGGLVGGELGALFDKLRAKKEQEAQAYNQYQNYGGR